MLDLLLLNFSVGAETFVAQAVKPAEPRVVSAFLPPPIGVA